MVELGLFDWSIWLVYLVLMVLLMWIYSGSRNNKLYSKYFILGFSIKVLGGLCFALIYVYYYGFGDTFLYHAGATELANTFTSEPGTYFELLTSKNGDLPENLRYYETIIPYSRTSEEWFMVKLLSPLNLISFNSYLVVTLFISLISFFGSWKLFRVFNDIFKSHPIWCFVAAFLVPSVFFWGSGILKDAISLAALNYFIYLVYFGLTRKKLSIGGFLGLVISAYLVYKLKSYIILAFLPCVVLIVYLVFQSRIKSTLLRYLFGPFMLGIFSLLLFVTFTRLSESTRKYSIEGLEKQAKGFHSWHTTTAGSSYNLGEIEYTFWGVTSKIPASLVVTFFRPYLWEARNVVMILSALESLMLLILLAYALARWGGRVFKSFNKNPFLYGFLMFCLLFGFVIGFTSYNFGALMRYKIPISSLIFFLLFIMVYRQKGAAIQDEDL